MRTSASSRRAAALILLFFVSQVGHAVRADERSVAESPAAIGNAVQVDAVQIDATLVNAAPESGGAAALSTRDDDAWLVSTRHLGCPSWKGEGTVDLEVSRYSDSGDWIPADLPDLLGSDPRLTIVYVHGNRIPFDDAIRRAWNAFGVLQADPSAPPMRLVIWSWPSDRIHCAVRDVRAKACRTNTEGQYLGWFLSQVDPQTPLSLIGYSFGARVVTGAMHVLGGGTLGGQSPPLASASGDRNPVQVILMAAAVHNYWLSPGGFHERFWDFADRVLVLYNTCDPALKRYRFVEKRGRPAAIGYTGARGLDLDQSARTEQRDVCSSVGKTHREAVFFSSAEVVQSVRQSVLYQATP